MRRRLLIALLALGTVGGYASGFASMARRARCHSWSRHHMTPPAPAWAPGAHDAPPAAPR
jgi:hypothetical protein